jgi:hypothetical protein
MNKTFPNGNRFEVDTTNRLRRIETRMLKAFEQMGISITQPEANIQLDENNEIIRVPTTSTTIGAIFTALDGRTGEYYLMVDGDVKGVLRV